MKKLTFLMFGLFCMLSSAFAADYENLYVVGNATDVGWNEKNPLEMTKTEDGIFTWEGDLKAPGSDQERFKFLVAKEWNTSITCRMNEDGHLVINSGEEYDLFVRGEQDQTPDNAFQVPENASYSLVVNLNTMKMTITKTGEPEEPVVDLNQLYISGSALSSEGKWDYDNPVEMTKTSDGVFSWTGDLYNKDTDNGSGNEFKFLNATGTWDKTICAKYEDEGRNEIMINKEYDLNFRPWSTSPDDFKFKIITAGRYTLSVNLNTMKMTVADGGTTDLRNTYIDAPFYVSITGWSIKVLTEDNSYIQSADLYDITGKCLSSAKNTGNIATLGEDLSTGIYFVKISINDKAYVEKVMIK